VMAVGDRTQKRRKQITDRLAFALTTNGNQWTTARGLTEMLADQRKNPPTNQRKRSTVTMRYMPTNHQIAKFVKLDERFEENPAEKLRQKEYRLKENLINKDSHDDLLEESQ
jgi:hypothetical protein